MKDLKYIAAYTIPIVAVLSIYLGGVYTYLTPLYVFGFIPLVELFTPASTKNIDENAK